MTIPTDPTDSSTLYGWVDAKPTDAHDFLLPGVVAMLPRFSHGGLKILDLGCGNGFLAGHLASLGHEVIAIDASPDGIAIGRQTYPDVKFFVRSIYEPLDDLLNSFDLVLSSEVIEHLYRPKALVKQAFAALKPGGIFIITTPYHGYLKNLIIVLLGKWDSHHTTNWEGGHIQFFSERKLSELISSIGFQQIKYRNVGRVPWLWKSMICSATKPETIHLSNERKLESGQP